MVKHISRRRKDDGQDKIKAKIKVLEDYLANKKVSEDAFIPNSEASFRLWVDPQLGLEKIGSPNTMNKPYNRALKKRVVELIKELAYRKHRRQGRSEIINTQNDKLKQKERLTRDLTSQVHAVRQELNRTQQEKRRVENRNAELLEKIAEMTQQMRVVKGLSSVRNGKGGTDDDSK